MKNIKDELQNIILGNEQIGPAGQLKKVQIFLRGYAKASISAKEQQYLESEETALLVFAERENLFYRQPQKNKIHPAKVKTTIENFGDTTLPV